MMLFLALGEFFNPAQTERLADAIVVALVTLLSLVPVLVALLQLKMGREIREIRQNQEFYRGKIDTISRRSDRGAGEGERVDADNLPALREGDLVGREEQTGARVERRRHAAPADLHSEPDSEKWRDSSDDPIKDVF